MAQQATITVFDGASTPVSHTLKGDGVKQDGDTSIASWKETVNTIPDYAQMRLTQLRQKLKSGTVKCTSRVEVPVMESIAGQNAAGYTASPKVAFVDRSEYVTFASPRSTSASKRLCMQVLINWMNNVTTTVTPVAAGVVSDLHQDLLMVS